MTSKLAFVVVPFTLLRMTLPASGQSAIKPPPEKTTTERVDFAPWRNDPHRRLLWRFECRRLGPSRSPSDGDQNSAVRLQSQAVGPGLRSPGSSADRHRTQVFAGAHHLRPSPPRRFSWMPPFWRHPTGGVGVEYDIHVPRNSRLAIHHGTGSVSVNDIAGDIDARVGRGGLFYSWLPPRFVFARCTGPNSASFPLWKNWRAPLITGT